MVIKEGLARQVQTSQKEVGDPVSYWQRSANEYFRHIEGITGGDGRMIRDEILHPRMLAHLGDLRKQTVLDIGSGDGILSRELVKQGAVAIAGDRIFNFVKAAVESQPTIPSVQQSAVDPLPFPQDNFDKVVSNLVLMWLPEIETFAHETYRVLKPGGRLVVSITHPMINLGDFDLSEPNRPTLKLQASLQDGVWLKMINETNGPYPYFQRPPAKYVNTITNVGFHLVPGQGYEDVFFPSQFVKKNPQYLKHQWFPLFLILAFEKQP